MKVLVSGFVVIPGPSASASASRTAVCTASSAAGATVPSSVSSRGTKTVSVSSVCTDARIERGTATIT